MRLIALLAVLLAAPAARARDPLELPPGLGEGKPVLSDPAQPFERRVRAARALGRYGPAADAVPVLVAALEGQSPSRLRDEVLRSLARRASPRALPTLLPLLAGVSGDGLTGSATPVLLALAAIGGEPAIAALVAALEEGAPTAPVLAALRRIGSPAVERLVRALDGPAGVDAARLLGQIGDRRAIGPLMRELSASDRRRVIAAVDALAALEATEAAPVMARLLRGGSGPVVHSALSALARVGSSEQFAVIRPLLEDPVHAPTALTALVAVASPPDATPVLERALGSDSPALRRAAVEAMLEAPRPQWVKLLSDHFDRDARDRERTASALARVAGGRGLPVLVRLYDAAAQVDRAGLRRAMALALRRFDAPGGAAALARLAATEDHGQRRWLLALARQPAVQPALESALASDDPAERADAAFGLQLLGARRAGGALRAALLRETDAEACRRMLSAVLQLGVPVDVHATLRRFGDPGCGPEAIALAAAAPGAAASPALRRALRRALHPDVPARTRVAAARALGRLQDTAAVVAIRPLLDAVSPRVRRAALTALGCIGGEPARAELLQHSRVEANEPLHRLALAARAGAAGEEPFAARVDGDQILEVGVSGQLSGAQRVLLDVVLPDGRWLRIRTRPGGDLVLPGLPAGSADVRIAD